ncbi:MAG: AAA family ATPase [Candidatus Omnitrophota bacterium]|nr:AAA family ATPase [Candidatus Omnitrophota bacterium]
MYFKKLEMTGFKSFCDKTTLNFEPGTTAIVGPNGTGKSNILDSIRWVLGEQSVKSLRGSDMQDVIFNGTETKEPLGMAEVSLIFDNQNRFFNFQHDELAITRRLFRSGESEYLLNKTPVRLRDVLDILSGTGIGAESYSIVAQGKIDLVLSSRPEDRRLVFDEASGITRYKAQKRETSRKLEETEQNLLRVNDIVSEVRRQIANLERQANKARKYKEVFEELKSKEIILAGIEISGLLKQKDELISQLRQLESKEGQLLEAIFVQESQVLSRQTELKGLDHSLTQTRRQFFDLENLATRNKERSSFNEERILELNKNESFLSEQIEQVKLKIIMDEEKLISARAEQEAVKKDIADKTGLLKEKDSQISSLDWTIKESLENISRIKNNIFDFVSRIANTKNELSEFNSQKLVFLSRKKRLDIDKVKSFQERAQAQGTLNNINQEIEGLKNITGEINFKISQGKADLEEQLNFLNRVNSDIENIKRQKLALESHKEFMEKLKTKYEDIADSFDAVVYLNKLPNEKVSGLVIKIKEEGNLAREENAGDSCYMVKLSGEAKPIELDTQKINEKINKLEEEIILLENERRFKQNYCDELNKTLFDLSQELRKEEISLSSKEASALSALAEFNKLKEEEDLLVMDLNDVGRELSVLEENTNNAQSSLLNLEKERQANEDLISEEENNIFGNNKLREQVLAALIGIKTELAVLTQRLASDNERIRIMEDTYRHDKENADNIEGQIKQIFQKRETSKEELKECQVKIEEAIAGMQNLDVRLKELQIQYQEISLDTAALTKKIDTDKKDLDALKEQLHELQLEDKEIDYKCSLIKDRMQQVYKIDILSELHREGQGHEFNALSEEIALLKQKVDSYGQVNLVAIQEYDELKQRYDFLLKQQTDLLDAKKSLHDAVLKLNRTTRQLFLETFEKVREEFRNYFRLLFNGGDARVYLSDEEDPLESGIEIIARPPGKKLQNVLLLSGGEKSLSAIALIFAIFKVKPSPFCILDEIDAALDEANVDRFSRILLEFAKQSQFLVITHNKKTIANADVMYGITMEQSGVSKIVSVKFSQNKQVKEAEAQEAAQGVMR